ncbi:adenosylmethionine--8-amino-7-oxononanoate transaminase [Gilvibacter sediminis]|uniref:adenosylmethionine--8-amino-7-oxononanoate transaminase n=1 Tax=Gilvibacter sediminis TaxID=379071 RepID=UPI0023503120|nr:adenosylmethionine--8-amino-7-oxononanoate transaminase [Gilvibacter sediminis]MDC7997139.1 adenosylmethionine--8-amino-7-oxononanoate transaminase [Gilvibacter sediminis]
MSLSKRDAKHLWHPLTQHKVAGEAFPIARANGVYLWDEQGNSYIDAISSWYISMYGHCNPMITSRVAEQMLRMDQIVFSGFTHETAVEMSEKLMELLPENQQKIFFSDNGSTSIEVAVKMALQYHFNRAEKRDLLIAFENGFHGDTFGAMSVSGLDVYNGPFSDFSLEVIRIPVPNGANNKQVLELLETQLATGRVAAFVFEPLVQGAAAMQLNDPAGLSALIEACHKAGALCIADEVMTGFGKTGTHFASQQLSHLPDIMCLSKALTAGLLPMGLTTCSQEIYDAFYSDQLADGFFHGHTYSANPLACAAAIAAMELLVSEEIQQNIQKVIASHTEFDQRIREHEAVSQTRQCGVIYALDLNKEIPRYGPERDAVLKYFMDRGIYLRPLGNTIYLVPPFVIKKEELDKIYAVIEEALVVFG